jgi:hypothetical protein
MRQEGSSHSETIAINICTVRRFVAIFCSIAVLASLCFHATIVVRSGNKRNQVTLTTHRSSVNASLWRTPKLLRLRRKESQSSLIRQALNRILGLRKLEDSNEEYNANSNEDEDNNEQEEDHGNSRDHGPGHDDFFREFIEDDDLGTKEEAYYHWDDSYFSWDVIDTKPKLFPIDRRKFVGFFIAFIGMLLGASGGAGGGGVGT